MNWGNKLLVTFLVFGSMMGYLVYRSLNTDFDLVEKDYYKNELNFQQVIDGSKRLTELNISPEWKQNKNDLVLELMGELKNKELTGEAWFYCAYDAKKDKKIPLRTSVAGIQVFPKEIISPGNYTVKMNWLMEGQYYYAEKKITIQ